MSESTASERREPARSVENAAVFAACGLKNRKKTGRRFALN
jgi:hypothetical protein